MLDALTLRRLWPRAPQPIIDAVSAHAPAVFAKYGLGSRLRVVHFMAQISHESGGGTITAENLNYASAERIAAVWPRRFTPASAAPYAHNPQKLADAVYNGRMGNAPGSEDGFNYRGRGLLQITGRDSYREIGALIGLPLEARPDLAFAPSVALEIAAAEFCKLGCLPFCDADNVEAVTRRVNGGYTGLASRKAWLAQWRAAIPEDKQSAQFNEDVNAETPPAPPVEIPRGSDEVLPAGVDHPGKTLAQDRSVRAVLAGLCTWLTSLAGRAVHAIEPVVTDPRFIAAAIVVTIVVVAIVIYESRARLRADHV